MAEPAATARSAASGSLFRGTFRVTMINRRAPTSPRATVVALAHRWRMSRCGHHALHLINAAVNPRTTPVAIEHIRWRSQVRGNGYYDEVVLALGEQAELVRSRRWGASKIQIVLRAVEAGHANHEFTIGQPA